MVHRRQYNEIRVSASQSSWKIDVALIPTHTYPEGTWHTIQKINKKKECKPKRTCLCVMRMAVEAMEALIDLMEAERMPPSAMTLSIHVTDLDVADSIRGSRTDLSLSKGAIRVNILASRFASFSVYTLNQDVDLRPLHHFEKLKYAK